MILQSSDFVALNNKSRERTSSDLIPLYIRWLFYTWERKKITTAIFIFFSVDALLCSGVCLSWLWILQWYRCHSFPREPGLYGRYRQMHLHYKFLYTTLTTSSDLQLSLDLFTISGAKTFSDFGNWYAKEYSGIPKSSLSGISEDANQLLQKITFLSSASAFTKNPGYQ